MQYEPQSDGTIHVHQGSRRLGVIEWWGDEWAYRSTIAFKRQFRYTALDLNSLQCKLLDLPTPPPRDGEPCHEQQPPFPA